MRAARLRRLHAAPSTACSTTGSSAPYLRYFNHKMSREAAVPIDEELESEIRAQQQRVLRPLARRHHPHLFPAATLQRRRRQPADLRQLPQHAQPLAGQPATSATNTAARCT